MRFVHPGKQGTRPQIYHKVIQVIPAGAGVIPAGAGDSVVIMVVQAH